MIKNVHCDYSVARIMLSHTVGPDFDGLRQFCLCSGISLDDEFLFLVLPDAAMPVLAGDIFIPVDFLPYSMSWYIRDELDGSQLCFQIGSANQPLADAIAWQMVNYGFIFVVFINSRSGAPKGMRIFKK